MSDLIDRQAAINGKIVIQCANGVEIYSDEAVPVSYLRHLPAADVVERSVYNQIAWERDVAVGQLKEIGKGLGEKMDDVVERKRGEWIYHKEAAWKYECKECGTYVPGDWNFCPNCGADMRGEQK